MSLGRFRSLRSMLQVGSTCAIRSKMQVLHQNAKGDACPLHASSTTVGDLQRSSGSSVLQQHHSGQLKQRTSGGPGHHYYRYHHEVGPGAPVVPVTAAALHASTEIVERRRLLAKAAFVR
jgi:hypothetical protein